MSLTLAEVMVKVGIDRASLNAGLDEAKATITSKMKSAEESSKMLLGGLAVAGAGILAFGAKSLQMAGNMETAQTAFTTMLGSAEKATALMKDLQQFGAETPFEFPEIQVAAKSLLAFGIGADEMKTKLREIGDVSSAVGAPIGEIAEIYGKAKTAGRLFAEDINQLTGRGIPIIQELAKQFNVSEGEVKGLVESGKVGFPELEKAFSSMTGEGGKFHDMMKAQSATLPGMWSTLMDNIGQSATVVGQELIKSFDLKEKLAGLIEGLDTISTLLSEKGLKGALAELFPPEAQATIVIIGGAILGALVPAFIALATAAWAAMVPLLPFMAAGAAIAALAFLIYTNWGNMKQFFVDLWTSVTATISGAITGITSTVTGWWTSITQGFSTAWNTIKTATSDVWNGIKNLVVDALKWLYDHNYYIKQLVDTIVALWKLVSEDTKQAWETITTFLSQKWQAISSTASNIWNGIKNFFTGLWNGISSEVSSTWEAIYSTISGKFNAISSVISNIGGTIRGIFTDLANSAYQWGSNLIGEFLDGFRSKIASVKAAASEVSSTVSKFLGFHSPAEEGAGADADKWGPNLITMFAQGIRQGVPMIENTVLGVSNVLSLLGVLPDTSVAGAAAMGNTMITGNTFYIREEADIDKVAEKLAKKQRDYNRGKGVKS